MSVPDLLLRLPRGASDQTAATGLALHLLGDGDDAGALSSDHLLRIPSGTRAAGPAAGTRASGPAAGTAGSTAGNEIIMGPALEAVEIAVVVLGAGDHAPGRSSQLPAVNVNPALVYALNVIYERRAR